MGSTKQPGQLEPEAAMVSTHSGPSPSLRVSYPCPHPHPQASQEEGREINNSREHSTFSSSAFSLLSEAFLDESTMCLKLFISLSRISTTDGLEYHIFNGGLKCQGQSHYALGRKTGLGAGGSLAPGGFVPQEALASFR